MSPFTNEEEHRRTLAQKRGATNRQLGGRRKRRRANTADSGGESESSSEGDESHASGSDNDGDLLAGDEAKGKKDTRLCRWGRGRFSKERAQKLAGYLRTRTGPGGFESHYKVVRDDVK